MWSRVLLNRQTKRTFGTFSKIHSSAISLSSTAPTRIKIPISSCQSIDYAIDKDLTVQEWADKIKQENDEVHSLDIEYDQTLKMEDLLQKRFSMRVNNQSFTVHPDLSTMVKLDNRYKVEEILGAHQFPSVRRNMLAMFLDHLVTELPDQPVTKTELKDAIIKAVKTYGPEHKEEMLQNIIDEIKITETELEELQEKVKGYEIKSASYASKMILFGVTMAAGQVGGFAYLIYGIYGWDDIEPMTYLTQTFYATVALMFWFRFRQNWEWSSAYGAFYTRRLDKLLKSNKVDSERLSFLKRYKELLQLHLLHMKN
jgi:hypothetical protein